MSQKPHKFRDFPLPSGIKAVFSSSDQSQSANNVMNQSQLVAKTCKPRQTRGNAHTPRDNRYCSWLVKKVRLLLCGMTHVAGIVLKLILKHGKRRNKNWTLLLNFINFLIIPLHAIWNKLFFSNLLKTLPFSSTNCKCQSNMQTLTEDPVTWKKIWCVWQSLL